MHKLAINTLLVVAMLMGVAASVYAQDAEHESTLFKTVPVNRPTFSALADFATYFDNKEYASIDNSLSETLFGARLTPKISLDWSSTPEGGDYGFRSHSLVFGADLVQDFGHDSKFVSDVNVLMYYNLGLPKIKVFAGIFPRGEMYGLRTPLFFDRGYRYYHNRIQGVMARYGATDRSFVEFAMDYTGMRSIDTRESFMIMSAARHALPCGFGFGYDFLMGHYAKDYNPATADGVVDNLMVTPFIRFDYSLAVGGGSAPISLGAEARYIVSLQRDRHAENVWCAPMGGEILVEAEWYGVSLRNRLYLGGNLLTHYDRYGADLYYGVPFYRTQKGIYDAIELSYNRSFCDNTLSVEAGISLDYDGVGWGTRQYILLGVNFGGKMPFKVNK